MIQFSTSKGRFAVVEVPKNTTNVKCYKFQQYWHVSYDYTSGDYTSGGFALFYKDFGGKKKYPASLELLFCANSVTEEDAKGVVDDYGNGMYYDYSLPEMFGYLRTALESLTSLLKSLQIDTSLCWVVSAK